MKETTREPVRTWAGPGNENGGVKAPPPVLKAGLRHPEGPQSARWTRIYPILREGWKVFPSDRLFPQTPGLRCYIYK